MIELYVVDYCQDCREFEPDIEKTDFSTWGGTPMKHDTLIFCKHRYRCNDMVEYLERRMREK